MVWTYQTACTQSDLLQNSMSLKKQASCRAIMVLSSKVASRKTVNMLLHKQASCRTTEVLSHKVTFHSRCYYTEASCEICQVVVTQSDSLSAPPLSAVLTHCTTLSVSAVLTQCTTPFSCTLTYPQHHPFQLYLNLPTAPPLSAVLTHSENGGSHQELTQVQLFGQYLLDVLLALHRKPLKWHIIFLCVANEWREEEVGAGGGGWRERERGRERERERDFVTLILYCFKVHNFFLFENRSNKITVSMSDCPHPVYADLDW